MVRQGRELQKREGKLESSADKHRTTYLMENQSFFPWTISSDEQGVNRENQENGRKTDFKLSDTSKLETQKKIEGETQLKRLRSGKLKGKTCQIGPKINFSLKVAGFAVQVVGWKYLQ